MNSYFFNINRCNKIHTRQIFSPKHTCKYHDLACFDNDCDGEIVVELLKKIKNTNIYWQTCNQVILNDPKYSSKLCFLRQSVQQRILNFMEWPTADLNLIRLVRGGLNRKFRQMCPSLKPFLWKQIIARSLE